MLAAATGCGAAGARENLWQAIEHTQAAVRSVELAVDLFQHDRTKQAAAAVTAQDMSDQIGMAQQQLVDVPAPTPELRGLRAQSQRAIVQTQVAVQEVTDALSAQEDLGGVSTGLTEADRTLQEVATAVGER